MKKEQRVKLITKVLNDLFPNPKIPLHAKDPYSLLIAVLLSAQCTDARVNLTTPYLFKLADTPKKMILLDPKEIEEIIRPCGLAPTKSRAIWKLSKEILDHHGGKVPRSMEELVSLPGVGRKTASVVMTQAFQ